MDEWISAEWDDYDNWTTVTTTGTNSTNTMGGPVVTTGTTAITVPVYVFEWKDTRKTLWDRLSEDHEDD